MQRATRGKTLRFNFGASIHRVVGLDLADAVFEPGSAEMRDQWKPRLELLLAELQHAPAVLRLSYVADLEDPALVEQRVECRQAADRGCLDAAQLLLPARDRAGSVLATRRSAGRTA